MEDILMGWDFKQIDEAYNRGYNQGYKHGIEDQQKIKEWKLPQIKPNHLESIVILVKPYNKKTKKYCQKNNIKYIKYDVVFVKGKDLYNDCNTDEPYSEEEYPDMALINNKTGILWNFVELWTSIEIPKWFLDKTEDENK